METVGSRLKRLRKEKKVTQEELAKYVGVTKTSIVYWERDESLPKHDRLRLIAEKLDTTIDYILYGIDQDEKNLTESIKLAQKIEKLGKDNKLTDEEIANISNIIDLLIKAKENKDAVANGTAPDNKSA